MEIDITEFSAVAAWDFSHSVAEGGDNAGRNTWEAAKACPVLLLKTPEQRAAFDKWVAEFGAWSDAEIAGWSEAEANGLFVQFIAGDIREAGADTLEGIDWEQYEAGVTAGRHAGNFFKGVDGRIYYGLDA